jgi:hypothetical protein
MKRKLIALMLVAVLAVTFFIPMSVSAADPTVTISVTAQVVSITNSQDTWTIGIVDVDEVVYFSADNTEDVDYSTITNTGNVAVDVEIQGTDVEGGDYDWTLAATAGDQQYSLFANSAELGDSTYDIEVKSSSYVDITTNLAADATWKWSMKMTCPTAFNAADDGEAKSATVTLVASEHV